MGYVPGVLGTQISGLLDFSVVVSHNTYMVRKSLNSERRIQHWAGGKNTHTHTQEYKQVCIIDILVEMYRWQAVGFTRLEF